MQANYDMIAPFYDALARAAFGKAIINAQIFLINTIPAGSRILIAGGGTGWILEELTRIHDRGLQVTYIELSHKMIGRSQKRFIGRNEVVFIQQPIHEAVINSQYDIIITPFFLDNFSPESAAAIFKKLHNCLHKNGLWLFADFQVAGNRQWQKMLLQIMYFFFRTLCNIEATHLPDSPQLFQQYGYKVITTKTFYYQFIISVVYQKGDRL